MYALTIALVLLAAVSFAAEPGPRHAAFLGVTVALAALTRAEALLLLVLLVPPLILWRPAAKLDGRGRLLAVTLGAAALVLAPWVVRNALTFSRHPVTVSNGTGFVIEISNCDQTYGLAPLRVPGHEATGDDAGAMLGYWAAECDRTPWVAGDETETGAAKLQTGLDYIRAHPGRFPVVLAARVGRIWDVWRPVQSRDVNAFLEGRGMGPTVAAMAMYYPLAVTAGGGLVVLRRRRQPLSPYLAIAAMTTLTAAVSFGITRYRVGADVALTVLAGVAIDAVLARTKADAAPEAAEPDPVAVTS
jgi:hypothetical protein